MLICSWLIPLIPDTGRVGRVPGPVPHQPNRLGSYNPSQGTLPPEHETDPEQLRPSDEVVGYSPPLLPLRSAAHLVLLYP